ncbi:MAG: sigma-70 family RNA polymerase sigma factor, partial [Acidobacteria bacterium]|nr:sigma-70 family RNA polymerase sigma factor [Acidobacteriota bacterium]
MNAFPAADVEGSVDHLFRHQAGQMVAALARVFGLVNLSLAEDVVQEAFVTALKIWPFQGVPDHPRAWLLRVARNKALDVLRRQESWKDKALELGRSLAAMEESAPAASVPFAGEVGDDRLRLIFACCHPAIPRDAQVALTLKTACGFSASEIARAFLARPSAVAQRLVRAKRQLREARVNLSIPDPEELPPRRDAVLEALYLMFNEGYGALEGEELVRRDLCEEAFRIARLLSAHPTAGAPEVDAVAAL